MAEGFKLFGFEITRAKDNKNIKSVVPPRDDDGAGYAFKIDLDTVLKKLK